MFYIYELIDPRNGKVFYVGKGKRGRINAHEREARKGVQSLKCDMIREIEAEGLTIKKHKVRTFTDERAAYAAEADLIVFYGLHNLTNVAPGGGKKSGQSVYDDHSFIAKAADVMGRMDAYGVQGLKFGNQFMDLRPLYDKWRGMVAAVIDRRGVDWVNEIAGRYRVKFV